MVISSIGRATMIAERRHYSPGDLNAFNRQTTIYDTRNMYSIGARSVSWGEKRVKCSYFQQANVRFVRVVIVGCVLVHFRDALPTIRRGIILVLTTNA